MPFQPTVLFAVAHEDPSPRLLQSQSAQNIEFTIGGTTITAFSLTGTLSLSVPGLADSDANFASAFTITFAGGTSGTIALNPAGFAALDDARRALLIQGFVRGGRLVLRVAVTSAPPMVTQNLPIELRALKTADFLLGAAGVAAPAHHSAPAPAQNVSGTGTFTYQAAPLGAGNLAVSAAGAITLTAAAPSDDVTRNLQLTIHTELDSATGSGGAGHISQNSNLAIDLHVPTDCVVLLDRSGSMGRVHAASGDTMWTIAKGVGNLFSQLYGTMVPNLSAPNGSITAQNRIGFGYFYSFGPVQTPFDGFVAANAPPSVDNAQAPGGGTPIGQALQSAGALFAASQWRRRHVLLLTDGMDNTGVPRLFDLTEAHLPKTPEDSATGSTTTGVTLHSVSYALPGDTLPRDLEDLASDWGGGFHHSAADADPLHAHGLKDMFLDVLSRILPVERATGGASTATVPTEDGVERAIFVATAEYGAGTPISASFGAQSTTASGQGNGYSWAIVDKPAPGMWTVANKPAGSSLFVLYDLSLRMRVGVHAPGLGQPIQVWAEIQQRGVPVTGADVRVGVRRPGESVGEVLTTFAQKQGLVKAFARGYLDKSVFGVDKNPLLGVAAPSSRNISPAAVDTTTRRLLLDAAEQSRNLELQNSGGVLTLNEVAPGRYEATLPAELTQSEGVYTFALRADGTTPGGYAFARDQRVSTALSPELDPAKSSTVSVLKVDGGWRATVLPVSVTGKPLGPGFAPDVLAYRYVDPATRKKLPALVTVDNLDGTYSVEIPAQSDALPLVELHFGREKPGVGASIKVDRPKSVRRVKVTLDRIQVLDDKDPCLSGRGELSFDALVAPNANPNRAVRTRIPEEGVLELSSGDALVVNRVLFEGLVEENATLSVTVGGKELDWLLFFERQEELARYHRTLNLSPGKHHFAPGDERFDPEALSDWRLWYTVDVD